MSIRFSVAADVKKLQRSLDDFTKKQLPFAVALAVTATAKRVGVAETAAIPQVFDRPTPFTRKAVAVIPARKSSPTAIVFIKDIQAKYLAPYEGGGRQVIKGRALLNPKNIRLNQYGNLPKGTVARLKTKPDTFVGTVKTKNGTVNGVWQRVPARRGQPGHLKLLVRFADGVEVQKHFDFQQRAGRVIANSFKIEMAIAIARALATAKR